MTLTKYNQKRDFKKTAEPKGVKKPSKGELRFVVQKHAASHLHYDFRLEIDGVLVSWAVPKGPSGNPSDKRLAMHVEDHPMDYIDFEGTIPKGEYGGGTVMVWDIGTYEPEGEIPLAKQNAEMKKQHKSGSIKIVLHGEKLKGSWALVQMHGRGENQWLLIKHKDAFSGKDVAYNPYSILTGRDFDAIAKGNDVWASERKKDGTKKSAAERKAVQKKAVAEQKSAKKEAFSSEDLVEAKRLDKFPSGWSPQLATLADAPFDSDDWLFETKFDGYRALAEIRNGECELISRNGISFNKKYPEIAETLSAIGQDIILDGEIVIEDDNGKSRFQWLQNREENPNRGTMKFYVFDILYFGNYDLRALDLLQRKKILKSVLPKLKNIVYSDHTIGDGIKAFEKAEKQQGEGIIAKKIASTYATGKRTKDWLKIKTEKQQEMVIGGFTEPSGSRKGLGALLCGYYDGKDFMYSGKVGSGYTQDILNDLRGKLDKLERKTSAFKNPPREKNVHWVTPKLVANIRFSEFTETNSMRHPVYQGLRIDKKAKDVKLELSAVDTDVLEDSSTALGVGSERSRGTSPNKKTTKNNPVKIQKTKTADIPTLSKKVEFSNLDKIFWPKEKITKGDVIAYYNSISDVILPYLKDRPQSMRRTPDGIKSEGFFQKNVADSAPKWAKTIEIQSDSKSEPVTWLVCNDKDTLLYMANIGCIEINPWSSRIKTLDHPDYIIFDFDPKGAPLENIVRTAHKVKEILDKLNVPAYIKTSGGNGLHVFIPVKPKYTYEQTREFSHLVSQIVHRDLPDITSLERLPSKRKGKVYLDFLQNGKGKTMASIYSIRPREGAGVSTPLQWDEINDDLDLKAYNINTIPKRLAQKGDLWADFFDNAIDLKSVLKNL
ncbi:DNA ligase D [Flavobacterium sp. MAH-1]|uniref:DNA ligase (ATP) n=1 Tax=Flavobacterium agri TaxID=2743471 RepID=A0A7Y8XZ26_9FLAO|nr:DNA ligase D [Flavobacterium agri]NUY79478.1 DNA ligase D [Flavobacterium agri]NYA69503.1 DNA ligase D [Flavobacterium agri]